MVGGRLVPRRRARSVLAALEAETEPRERATPSASDGVETAFVRRLSEERTRGGLAERRRELSGRNRLGST